MEIIIRKFSEIRGEILMPWEVFEELKLKKRPAKNLSLQIREMPHREH